MEREKDICTAEGARPILHVLEARPLDGSHMEFLFPHGERRVWNRSTLTGGAFLPLQDESVFRAVRLFHGVPTWNSGTIDIAPEWLLEESNPVREVAAALG
jgi:hypothetical protein